MVLYLLSPRNGKYLHPAHITTLTLGDANAFSKKDRDVRLKYDFDDLVKHLHARRVNNTLAVGSQGTSGRCVQSVVGGRGGAP